jgi:hypothetical protein
MIGKIIVAAFVAFGYSIAIFRPALINTAPMRDAVSYDGLSLIALIFTVTTAAAVTVNARVLEIKRRLPQSEKVVSASTDLRRTMRRNTLGFFYGFFIAAGSYFTLTFAQPESQLIAAILIVTFFSVLIVGFYLALDVY